MAIIDSRERWKKCFSSSYFRCELECISIAYCRGTRICKEAQPGLVAIHSCRSQSLKLSAGIVDSDEGNRLHIFYDELSAYFLFFHYGPVMEQRIERLGCER